MLLHTNDMTWIAEENRLVTWASDLGMKAGKIPHPIISVVSHRTGNIQKFLFYKNHFVGGELAGWFYECADTNVACSLLIFND